MPIFRRKPFLIHARRVRGEEPEQVQTFTRVVEAAPGDWVLGMENEHKTVFSDVVFRSMYEPVDEEAEKELEG